jgi:hypothetical protein
VVSPVRAVAARAVQQLVQETAAAGTAVETNKATAAPTVVHASKKCRIHLYPGMPDTWCSSGLDWLEAQSRVWSLWARRRGNSREG